MVVHGQIKIKITRQAARTTLVSCRKTLDALLQSMSQRQVSHSLLILTCDETERAT